MDLVDEAGVGEAVSHSALIAVDTYEGAVAQAGDLVQPLRSGLIPRSRIGAELAELYAGSTQGRSNPAQITLFKSAGTAIEDYAAATLVIESRANG